MHIEILPVQEYHKPRLRDIFVRSRIYAFPWAAPEGFKPEDFDHSVEGETVWVACYEQVPVGFVSLYAPENFIHFLFVDPDWLRKGIGLQLLNYCLDRTSGPATLKCLCANKAATAFYLSNGWQITGSGQGAEGEYRVLAFPSHGNRGPK